MLEDIIKDEALLARFRAGLTTEEENDRIADAWLKAHEIDLDE